MLQGLSAMRTNNFILVLKICICNNKDFSHNVCFFNWKRYIISFAIRRGKTFMNLFLFDILICVTIIKLKDKKCLLLQPARYLASFCLGNVKKNACATRTSIFFLWRLAVHTDTRIAKESANRILRFSSGPLYDKLFLLLNYKRVCKSHSPLQFGAIK